MSELPPIPIAGDFSGFIQDHSKCEIIDTVLTEPGTTKQINTSGQNGKHGINGEDGKDGTNGKHGKDAPDQNDEGRDGISAQTSEGKGGDGTDGTDGKSGTDAENGKSGTDITIELSGDLNDLKVTGSAINDSIGQINRLFLTSKGGDGGNGGRGGRGGNGGKGGNGGRGGRGGPGKKASEYSRSGEQGGRGGHGGDGGKGGNAGRGADGGVGKNGGNAGKIIVTTTDPRLLVVIRTDAQRGKGGIGGSGGQAGNSDSAGVRGEGGPGGPGGKGFPAVKTDFGCPFSCGVGNMGHTCPYCRGEFCRSCQMSPGGKMRAANVCGSCGKGVFDRPGGDGRDGQTGDSGFNGSSGNSSSSGHNGSSGQDGTNGTVKFIVKDESGNVINESDSCFGPQIVSFRVCDSDCDGVFQPGEDFVVDQIVVKNNGGLPLPTGAVVFLTSLSKDTEGGILVDEGQALQLPEMQPGETVKVEGKLNAHISALQKAVEPNSKPFSSTSRFCVGLSLMNISLRSNCVCGLRVHHPVRFMGVDGPSAMGPGKTIECKARFQNLSSKPYSSAELNVKASKGLVVDNAQIMVPEIPAGQEISVPLSLTMDTTQELYTSVDWELTASFNNQVIAHSTLSMKSSPVFDTDSEPNDLLFVTGPHFCKEEFTAWNRIFSILGVRPDLWDVEVNRGLSVDADTGKRHEPSWIGQGRYEGCPVILPVAQKIDGEVLNAADMISHLNSTKQSEFKFTVKDPEPATVLEGKEKKAKVIKGPEREKVPGGQEATLTHTANSGVLLLGDSRGEGLTDLLFAEARNNEGCVISLDEKEYKGRHLPFTKPTDLNVFTDTNKIVLDMEEKYPGFRFKADNIQPKQTKLSAVMWSYGTMDCLKMPSKRDSLMMNVPLFIDGPPPVPEKEQTNKKSLRKNKSEQEKELPKDEAYAQARITNTTFDVTSETNLPIETKFVKAMTGIICVLPLTKKLELLIHHATKENKDEAVKLVMPKEPKQKEATEYLLDDLIAACIYWQLKLEFWSSDVAAETLPLMELVCDIAERDSRVRENDRLTLHLWSCMIRLANSTSMSAGFMTKRKALRARILALIEHYQNYIFGENYGKDKAKQAKFKTKRKEAETWAKPKKDRLKVSEILHPHHPCHWESEQETEERTTKEAELYVKTGIGKQFKPETSKKIGAKFSKLKGKMRSHV